MKCILCETEAPADASQCPTCGDALWPWRHMLQFADRLLGEASFYASNDDVIRATLRFTMAAALRPDDPVTLRSLGQFLAANGVLEDAAYYLDRCITMSQSTGCKPDATAQAALAQVQAQQETENSARGTSIPPRVLLVLDELKREGGCNPEHAPHGMPGAKAWHSALSAERQWCPEFRLLTEVLECESASSKDRLGPRHYLLGLAACTEGRTDAAAEHFRQSIMADDTRRNAEVYLLHLAMADETLDESAAFVREHRSDEDVVTALRLVAEICTTRNELDAAVRVLHFASEQMTAEYPKVTRQLVNVLLSSERAAEAQSVAEAALQRMPTNEELQELTAQFANASAGRPDTASKN